MSDKARRFREMRRTLGAGHPDTQEAFVSRLAEVLAVEAASPEPGLWWLSFTDPSRPKGDQFLGVAVVEAIGHHHALRQTHILGINPGGEVAGWGPIPVGSVATEWRNRLLSRDEAEALQTPRP